MNYLFQTQNLALTTQQWTLILLAICVLPIAVLIILAIVFRIKNSVKKNKKENLEEVDEEQRKLFLNAFGGEDNYISVASERIKVIVKVKDPDLVQGEKLKELGANGVLIVGNEIRCSFGDRALYVYNTINSTNKKEEPANLSEEKEENE